MSYDDSARLIWSLAASGLGSAITAAGNSGAWSASASLNARTAVDLRRVDDLWLSVIASGVSGAGASLTVSLGCYDDQGGAFPGIMSAAALTAAGTAGGKVAFGGRHAGGSGAYVVLSEWGVVSWALAGTSPAFTGVQIALYGR